jgi:hypothetical protein
VENNAHSLATTIRRTRALPLREMGRRGRCWMQREFSWDAVSRQMLVAFQDRLRAPRGSSHAETLS